MPNGVKSNVGGGVTGLTGYHTLSSKSKLDGTTFVGPSTSEGRALRQAFKGKAGSTRLLTKNPDNLQIARGQQTGLFNLSSFQKVKSPQPLPVPQVQGGPPQGHIQPPLPDDGVPGGDIVIELDLEPTLDQRVAQTTGEDIQQLTDRFTAWRDNRPEGGKLKGDRGRTSIFERDRLNASVTATLNELRSLERAIRSMPDGEERGDQLKAIAQAKREAVLVAIKLAMPGLDLPPDSPLQPKLGELVDNLLLLHERLLDAGERPVTGLGKPVVGLDKLIGVLSSHARIRELSELPTDKAKSNAVVGMSVLIEAIVAAVGPGRDGVELNAFLGLNGELDGALKHLRFAAIRDLLAEHRMAVKGELDDDDWSDINALARDIVTQDAEIARARQQIRRALEAAGAKDFDLTGLSSLRIDSSLIKGLREQLGKNAKQIGLIVAGLRAMEQTALQSEGTAQLREALEYRRDRMREQLNDDIVEFDLDRQIAAVERRLQSLTPEIELLRNQLAEAHDVRQTWEDRRIALLDRQGATIPGSEKHTQLGNEISEVERRIAYNDSRIVMLERQLGDIGTEGLDHARDVHEKAGNTLTQARVEHDRLVQEMQTIALLISVKTKQEENELVALDDDELDALQNVELAELSIGQLQQRLGDTRLRLGVAVEQVETAHMAFAEAEANLDEQKRLAAGRGTLTGGLTPEELTQLGLSDRDFDEIANVARGFARQGLSSARQVESMCRHINSLLTRMQAPFTDSDTSIGGQLGVLGAGDNDTLARRLGDRLVGSLTGQSTLELTGDDIDERMRVALFGEDGRLARLGELLGEHPLESDLGYLAQAYTEFEQELVLALHDDAERFRQSVEQVQNFEGRRIDPKRPQGLALSQALVQAKELLDLCGDDLSLLTDHQLRELRALQDVLRGFDPNTLEVPFIQLGRTPPRIAELRAWVDDENLMQTAHAIVFLRQDAPQFRQDVQGLVSDMDAIVDRRMALMGPAGEALRDTIRAAILHTLAQTGSPVSEFNPSDHAGAIKATLERWGVPVDFVLPEINRMLSESFGPDELNLWQRTTTLSEDYLSDRKTEAQRRIAQRRQPEIETLRPEVAKALVDSIDDIQPGTRVRMTVGDRFDMQTGRIPVVKIGVPGAEIGVTFDVRLMVGPMSGLEIQRSGDGYELIVRRGGEFRVGGDIFAGPTIMGINVEGVGTLEGAGYRVAGVSLRFPNTEAGRDALKSALENLLTQGKVTPRDLSGVDNIMPLVESRGVGRAQLGAQARYKGTEHKIEDEPFPGGKLSVPMPSGIARAGLGITGGYKSFTATNTNMTVKKTTRERIWEATASINLYYAFPDQITPNSPSSHLQKPEFTGLGVDLQGGLMVMTRTRTRETRGSDGLVTPSTIRNEQMSMPLHWGLLSEERRRTAVAELGGPALKAMLERLSDSEREEIDKLIATVGSGDMINITFDLDERVRGEVNDLLLQAKALRSGRMIGVSGSEARRRAKELETEAQRMIDDPSNYNPSKLQVLPTRENLQNFTALNLFYLRWDRYVEDKSEWVAAEIAFDPVTARLIREELSQQQQ